MATELGIAAEVDVAAEVGMAAGLDNAAEPGTVAELGLADGLGGTTAPRDPDETSCRIAASREGWRAELSLVFAEIDGRTRVRERAHRGPLCIQRPFYPGDGACHLYVLHPPGGLAGGDRLTLTASAAPGAAVLLTTPAATKFYRSLGPNSVQEQRLHVADGAALEWLPLDTILFGGSRADVTTRVELEPDARFIAWEMTALGRPLSGDRYADGRLRQRTEIHIGGEPALIERLRWRAGDPIMAAGWGLAAREAVGALYAYPADDAVLAAARGSLERHPEISAGATRLGDLLVTRALGAGMHLLREAFEDLWRAVREPVTGRSPCPPRIWRT